MSDRGSVPDPNPETAAERLAFLKRLVVTTRELSLVLSVSERTITEHVGRGVLTRLAPGRFLLMDSVASYIAHLRALADAGGDLSRRRAEESAERAKLLRLKVAEAEGALVPAAAVEAEWQGVLRGVRARMLAVPSRFASMTPGMTVALASGSLRRCPASLQGDSFYSSTALPSDDTDDPGLTGPQTAWPTAPIVFSEAYAASRKAAWSRSQQRSQPGNGSSATTSARFGQTQQTGGTSRSRRRTSSTASNRCRSCQSGVTFGGHGQISRRPFTAFTSKNGRLSRCSSGSGHLSRG